ncbi:MAG: amino acid adenylation domain-containing protein [Kiritimatiellia bacterium]
MKEEPLADSGALSVAACFEAQVDAFPTHTAIRHAHGDWSYAQLDRQANQLAAALREMGVGSGSLVGVCLSRSPWAIVALLGILKAGGSYLPLEPTWPVGRRAFVLADADVKVLLTETALQPECPVGAYRVFVLDAEVERLSRMPAARVAAEGDTESPAYIMYTSGSTGEPKGVIVPQRGILRLVRNVDYVALGPAEVLLQAAPLAFDASTFEIWGALLNGGAVALHAETLPTAVGLGQSITRHRVTTAWLTAALFNAVVDEDPRQLIGLRQLLIGGEALSVPHVRKAQAVLPGVRLINGYGPTETTTFATCYTIPAPLSPTAVSIPIGKAIRQTSLYLFDGAGQLVPPGETGELYIGGAGVALGYLKRPELTDARFVVSPTAAGARLFRTGDLARLLPDGNLDYLGRQDQQVKIRGFRIELGEIEAAIRAQAGIRDGVVLARARPEGEQRLTAYLVWDAPPGPGATRALRTALAARLPEYMVPAAFVTLPALPVTANGKIDRQALPEPGSDRPELAHPFVPPGNPYERLLCAVWEELLGIRPVGIHDNFFELGGHSLLALRMVAKLKDVHGLHVPVLWLFQRPSVAGIAAWLAAPQSVNRGCTTRAPQPVTSRDSIAIVGMAGRFPGAPDLTTLWDVLREGRDTHTVFTDATLAPEVPEELRRDPHYVRARAILADAALFDAGFFGISPREAAIMDPQQRLLLEVVWEALEDAGCVPETFPGRIGIFAGKYNNSYWSENVSRRPDLIAAFGAFQTMVANEKDYVATRIAHRLDLRGPALSIHTACSTSLVAVVQALLALRAGQCDLALAGGVSLTVPVRSGYLYQEGGMLSQDGRCRPFDAAATGTTFSDGVGVVALKRLRDALADGDQIYAVVRGGAVNNDGGCKASFTAPVVAGQADVIAMAHADAGVEARAISYVEAHGTATPLGDPIEVAALTQAFRATTPDIGFCALGSIKGNLGHSVIAAGAAGLIKTALSLQQELIPASLYFTTPNPQIDFSTSPFRVAQERLPWPRTDTPRLAGVSSFGVGGTNAHVVVEEAPAREPSPPTTEAQLLVLSARSAAALDQAEHRLRNWLGMHPAMNLADVAWTLQVGRKAFSHRRSVLAFPSPHGTPPCLAESGVTAAGCAGVPPRVCFRLPGSLRPDWEPLYSDLLTREASFRDDVGRCQAWVAAVLGHALPGFPPVGAVAEPRPAAVASCAHFAFEYALAALWMRWGVKPAALYGEGVGEIVGAVLAGVMPLTDALALLSGRGLPAVLAPPVIPLVSARTGTLLRTEDATAVAWWQNWQEAPRGVDEGLRAVAEDSGALWLEVGCSAGATPSPRPLISAFALARPPDGDARAALLCAAGELWCAGVALDFPALHRQQPRRRVSLPTYPFERDVHWIEPVLPVPAATPHLPPAGEVANPARLSREELVAALVELLEETSGLDVRQGEPSAHFVELGLDSLALTQAALALARKFKIPVSFRQLSEELCSLNLLTDYVQRVLQAQPPGTAPTPPTAPAVAPAPDAGVATTNAGKQVFGAMARIHGHTGEQLTPYQRTRLAAFIQRYNARTKGSKHAAQENRDVLADPRVVTGFRPMLKEIIYPLAVDRSQGAKLWDVDGNEYVDVLNGFGCNLFGWQPEFVTRAVEAQLRRGHEIGPQTPLAGEVARLLCDMTGLDRAAFCNTGSEAVMGCMRIARTVTGRSTIAIFTGSYHGIFDEVIVRSTKALRAVPAAPGILPASSQNMLVLDYGTPESLRLLAERAGDLAAIMVEPVQSRRPDFQPQEFLRQLREICSRHGTVYIFDEVITGFRTGPGGAQAHFGVQADLATYGKVVGGGYPIGIIAGKRPFMDALDGGRWQYGDDSMPTVGVTYFAGTFVRHPLALAAAKAVLLHLREQGPRLQQDVTATTTRFAEMLNAFFREVGAPLEIRHFASLWKTFFTAETPFSELLFAMLRDRGVHILDGFPCFFTTAHQPEHVEFVLQAFRTSVIELQEAGFLAGQRNPGAPVPALTASTPPVPGARLGRDPAGNPAWYITDPDHPGKYLKVSHG